MPRFLCYCPDYPDVLEKRLAVRAGHLAAAQADKDAGRLVEGAALLARPGTEAANAVLAEGTLNLRGSFMVYVYPSAEICWERVRDDAYWKAGVWDKERTDVWPLLK